MSADPASETAAATESAPKRARGRERERRIDRRSLLRPGDGPMVVFDKVVKRYAEDATGLDGVSLSIESGEFVFLVGASGSGKSTFIRMLIREIEPTEGRVMVGGRDLAKMRRSKRHLRVVRYRHFSDPDVCLFRVRHYALLLPTTAAPCGRLPCLLVEMGE